MLFFDFMSKKHQLDCERRCVYMCKINKVQKN